MWEPQSDAMFNILMFEFERAESVKTQSEFEQFNVIFFSISKIYKNFEESVRKFENQIFHCNPAIEHPYIYVTWPSMQLRQTLNWTCCSMHQQQPPTTNPCVSFSQISLKPQTNHFPTANFIVLRETSRRPPACKHVSNSQYILPSCNHVPEFIIKYLFHHPRFPDTQPIIQYLHVTYR